MPIALSTSSGLVEDAASRLRRRILNGEFGDGDLPSQGQLALELGVSRTVLREAVRMLECQGLLSSGQGRRSQVRPVDGSALADNMRLLLARGAVSFGTLLELRRPVESEAAALAAQRATPATIDALRISVRRLETAKSLSAQIDADRQFHALLAEASGNVLFTSILTALTESLDESRKRTIGKVGPDRAIKGHTAILQAVTTHSQELARKAMLTHLDEAAEDLWLNNQ